MKFKRILVPLDGSGTADNAFQCALDMAETYHAELYVLSVADVTETAYPLLQVNLDKDGFTNIRETARIVLDKAQKLVPDTVHFTPVLKVGVPGNVIASVVEEKGIDLVIMGNSGKGSLSSFITGSVSQYVIHHVKVPVLIIK